MMAAANITRVKNLIVGLGKTGLSCARYFARRGETFAVADSRDIPPGLEIMRKKFPSAKVYLGKFDAAIFEQYSNLIVSPGVAQSESAIQQAKQRGSKVFGDVELFAQELNAPVIAVTGSNGKSTVVSLLEQMFIQASHKVFAGGNIGEPVLDLLARPRPDFYILELSSFQLETLQSLQPRVAAILNISADHMDRYPDFAAYAAAKSKIYQGAENCVFNHEDVATIEGIGNHAIGFGSAASGKDQFGLAERGDDLYLLKGEQLLLPAKEVPLSGKHNLLNVLAALAIGDSAGLPMPPMLQAIRQFKGLLHRAEWVAERDGVTWINDSKGTNVGATCAAISGLGRRVVLIAGGVGKGADFSPLVDVVKQHVPTAILIGAAAQEIGQVLQEVTNIIFASNMRDAITQAQRQSNAGDCVLLSPACASFDMYVNYEARGDDFKKLVLERLA